MRVPLFKRRSRGLAAVLLTLAAGAVPGGATEVRSLEALVGRWVDLRTQLHGEARAWEQQAAQWRQEMELLRVEHARLDAALGGLEQANETQMQRSADLLVRRHALQEPLTGVHAVLVRMEPALSTLLPLLPVPLLTDELRAVLAAPAQNASGTVRLQRVLGALKVIEELHNGVHTVRALIEVPDRPRYEMDVIFIGLARGFAVTTDGSMAAAGVPTAAGWRWTAVPAAAGGIRRMVQIAKQDVPPALVSFAVGGTTGLDGDGP